MSVPKLSIVLGDPKEGNRRNTTYPFDFSRVHEIEGPCLFDNRAQKLDFTTAKRWRTPLLYLCIEMSGPSLGSSIPHSHGVQVRPKYQITLDVAVSPCGSYPPCVGEHRVRLKRLPISRTDRSLSSVVTPFMVRSKGFLENGAIIMTGSK